MFVELCDKCKVEISTKESWTIQLKVNHYNKRHKEQKIDKAFCKKCFKKLEWALSALGIK